MDNGGKRWLPRVIRFCPSCHSSDRQICSCSQIVVFTWIIRRLRRPEEKTAAKKHAYPLTPAVKSGMFLWAESRRDAVSVLFCGRATVLKKLRQSKEKDLHY